MRTWNIIKTVLGEHPKCALVSVLDGKGSVPRENGARMIVVPGGGFRGTIGGGALEWAALEKAQSALGGGSPAYRKQRLALGPELGQCCGGSATIAIEIFVQADLEQVSLFARSEADGIFVTRGTLNAQGRIERQLMPGVAVEEAATWTDDGHLMERFGEAERDLFLFGAGHVGRAIILALAPLPFQVTWIDSRADGFPAHVPANVTKVHMEAPVQAMADLPGGAFVLVMTHSHATDQEITHAALASDRAAFVGLIGSQTKKTRFERRMAQAGLSAERIGRLVCPIGLADIRSKKPAAIAASTAAQLLAVDERLRAGKMAPQGTTQAARETV